MLKTNTFPLLSLNKIDYVACYLLCHAVSTLAAVQKLKKAFIQNTKSGKIENE